MSNSLIEDLYFDAQFDNYIKKLARLRGLVFEDLKQDAFVEMLDSEAATKRACKSALMRVADRASNRRDPNAYTYEDDFYVTGDSEKGEIKDWYWSGVDPRMNEDVDPDKAWT